MAVTTVDFGSFGTAGNTVAASDDPVILDVGNDPTYVTETALGGTVAVEFDPVWDRVRLDLGSSVGKMYMSFPIEITDPAGGYQNPVIAQVQAASGGEGVAQVRLNSDRTFQIRDKAAAAGNTTYAVPTGTTVLRLEWLVDRTAGTQELRVYDAASGGSLVTGGTVTGNATNSTSTTFAELRLGPSANNSTEGRTWRMDQVAWDTVDWVDDGGGTPPVADAAHTSTSYSILLDATGTTDATSYLWTETTGATGSFDDNTSATPTWTGEAGTFQVAATGAGGTDTDTVSVGSDAVQYAVYATLVPRT